MVRFRLGDRARSLGRALLAALCVQGVGCDDQGITPGPTPDATLDATEDASLDASEVAPFDVTPDVALDVLTPPSDTGLPPPRDTGLPPPRDTGTTPVGDGGSGPRACTTPADCVGACPAASRGCTCATTGSGQRCSPTCTEASDCPPNGAGTVFECRSGVCAPQRADGGTPPGDGGPMPPRDGGPTPGDGGPMPPPGDGGMTGPRACSTTADCTGACPPEARGCVCATTPSGQRCAPSCSVSSDCPSDPAGTVFECSMGYCAPARPDGGPPPGDAPPPPPPTDAGALLDAAG